MGCFFVGSMVEVVGAVNSFIECYLFDISVLQHGIKPGASVA